MERLIRVQLQSEPGPAAIQRIRQLRRYAQGQFHHEIGTFAMYTLLPDIQGTRQISTILEWDMSLRCSQGEYGTALEDVEGIIAAAHVFDHDPIVICGLVRMAMIRSAARATQRLLAQTGQIAPSDLQRLQETYSREESLPSLRELLRWLRAAQDHDLRLVHQGKATLRELSGPLVASKRVSSWSALGDIVWKLAPGLMIEAWARPEAWAEERAKLLRLYGTIIRLSELPEQEMAPELRRLQAEGLRPTPFVAHLFAGVRSEKEYAGQAMEWPVFKVIHAIVNYRACCRSSTAALACERFRVERGRWPAKWEELQPTYLSRTTVDPWTGKSLIMKQLTDGLVVYSVGADVNDDGGEVLPTAEGEPRDIGFRLWDPQRRGVDMNRGCEEFVRGTEKQD